MLEELRAILAADFGPQVNAATLAETLYQRCYTHSIFESARSKEEGRDLTAALMAANRSREGWDLGWRVEQGLDDGRVLASKDGAARAFAPGQYIALNGPGAPFKEGQAIRVYAPAGSADVQPSFYHAIGETVSQDDEFEDLLRFYWNITADGAPRLMETLTGEFNRFHVPFRFKCGRTEAMCGRRDAAVLYVHRRYYAIALWLAERVQAVVADDLREDVPLFTRRIARGVGFAEDPGESFGQNRCRILAEAMMTSREIEEVRRRFAAHGLSLDAPWAGTSAPLAENLPVLGSRTAIPAGYLDMAARLGGRLCRDAIWHGSRCNWTANRGGSEQTYTALGPLFYTGTAGIALFLWRLFQATGDPIFQRTAEGALGQALSKLPLEGSGYFIGPLGILAVASEITGRTDREAFLRAQPDPANPDVIAGSAGAIAALLRFGFVELAVRHGDMILVAARRSDHGWSWKTVGGLEGLRGFAHGSAGIGWSLAELFRATGESRFRDAALEAFRYERNSVDPSEEAVWCNGAAGIALARLRVSQILNDQTLCDEASSGLAFVRDGLMSVENFSLCHGVAGNADILLEGGDTDTAELAADLGMERYERPRIPWRSGLRNGCETPDLMWGTAGIGYFYLRLADRSMPSVLLPQAGKNSMVDRSLTVPAR